MSELSQIPPRMTAIVQDVYGGPEVLHFAQIPRPALRPQDLLVRVRAIAVNPVDTKVRAGGPANTPVPDAPKILGWDGAGIVAAVGPEVGRFQVGDEVYFAGDITRAGCYAEYVAVDERIVGHKPQTLSFEAAAAMPLTSLTAWEGIIETLGVDAGGRNAGRSILIVGGGGGVGSIAIQIAKRVCRLHVVATASRPESQAQCRKMGADQVIDHSQRLRPQLQELGYTGVDYIFSAAPLGNFPQLVEVLNPLGKICLILGGPEAKALDVSGLVPIRGSVAWELMFTRPRLNVEPEKQGAILDRVAELLDDQTLESTLSAVLSWRDIQEAHRMLETGHTIGKIALRVDG